MGIMGNVVSLTQFRLNGKLPQDDPEGWIGERLAKVGFQSIDDIPREKSTGWVALDDMDDNGFADRRKLVRHPYVCFSLRRDERKVPRATLNQRVDQACKQWLAEHQNLKWVPKDRKTEIKEAIHQSLLAKTLAAPTILDVVWNIESGILYAATLAQKELEGLEKLFAHTFEGFSIAQIHPYARAQRVLEDKYQPALARLNKAGSDQVVDLIKDNLWIGREFLLWLLHRSRTSSSDYQITQDGPGLQKTGFIAYLDTRVLLETDTGEGIQRVVCTGPQARFNEARTALVEGKQIAEAMIYLEQDEDLWRLSLKGEFFRFGSLKTPRVRIERDEQTDEESERESVFYERMSLVESGLQMFDSLFQAFLYARLSRKWKETLEEISGWCRKRG